MRRWPTRLCRSDPKAPRSRQLFPSEVGTCVVASAMPNRVAVPTGSEGAKPSNRLLRALPVRELSDLQPYLEPLSPGTVVVDANQSLAQIYFVESGVISLLAVVENRAAAGVATIGREGAVGVAMLLLGGEAALGRCQVLVPGLALAMEVSRFRSALQQSSKLRAACEAWTRVLFIQVLQAVSCGRLHTVEQRCARWLLMCADQTEREALELTQEGLAGMLGVPRTTLADATCTLERAGLICHRRDGFTVLDRRGLEAAACDCYRIVRDRCDRLVAPTLRD
jgi:CRP-like cAMP-binding protein